MTTKYKIVAGFSAMLVIALTLSFVGYRTAQNASEGLEYYSSLAQANVELSDGVGDLFAASYNIERFIQTYETGAITTALKYLEDADRLVGAALPVFKQQKNITAMTTVRAQLQEYIAATKDLQNAIVALQKNYWEEFIPQVEKMVTSLQNMANAAQAASNSQALRDISRVQDAFAKARVYAALYVETLNDERLKVAEESFALVQKEMEVLNTHLSTMEGRRIYAELAAEFNEWKEGFTAAVALSKSAKEAVNKTYDLDSSIFELVSATNKAIDTEATSTRSETLDQANAAEKQVLLISAIGLVLGLGVMAFIIIGLTKTLGRLGRYAEEIAAGHFEADAQVTERGEIGNMVASMKQIPSTLENVLDEYHRIGSGVENGNLATKGNDAAFQGGFATLINGTNEVLDRFLTVIENIPSPVVLLSGELKAAYINKVARTVAGEDYIGKTCFELFARDDFGSPEDALTRAVESKAPATAETRAHPQGRDMDISYTAIPMQNAQGKISAVMQLITDLTEIKEHEKTMLRVAEQASEISNRVAAASEELSAQVEQVSRGAEMQRERVESTASAMTEMNSTVLEVARSAGQASEQSEQTRGKAEDGAKLVNQVVQSIQTVNQITTKLHANMQELGTQAESVGGVMNVISDIADQTNLLALNAAIEAARAGEAGRGFAVVADEVRKLAEKTMQATQEVGSNISAIQDSARQNVDAVADAAKAANEAAEIANSSGGALSEIVDLASGSSALVTSIATAAEEQSATSEEINHSIEEINQVVGETTDGMVQASAAVQELSQMAQELNRVMEELK